MPATARWPPRRDGRKMKTHQNALLNIPVLKPRAKTPKKALNDVDLRPNFWILPFKSDDFLTSDGSSLNTATGSRSSQFRKHYSKFPEREFQVWDSAISLLSRSSMSANLILHQRMAGDLRQSFTPQQINEACYVDVNGNRDAFEGVFGSRNAKYHVKSRDELIILFREYLQAILLTDLKDAYPNVIEDLQALKSAGQTWHISDFDSHNEIVFPNDSRVIMEVDDEIKRQFRSIELPRDMLDIEKDLQKNGMEPATNTAKRRAAAQVQGISFKPKPKQQVFSSKAKLANVQPFHPRFRYCPLFDRIRLHPGFSSSLCDRVRLHPGFSSSKLPLGGDCNCPSP
ncbi:omega-amidase NIT2-A-like [Hibiscus syriacus]|uniref:Omega-amidase NIT2-A-like n=1 Tax=Hibiscus syriacus TaxID=106335 RepID=A0A6A2ZEN4_HIBSY|nr:omega-amidase NIT2-A-like [Hibiscus syriacus]